MLYLLLALSAALVVAGIAVSNRDAREEAEIQRRLDAYCKMK